ncbi:hypothetical protein AAEP93_002009 [Penicillium crustosum]
MGNSNSNPNMKPSKSAKSDNDRAIEPSSSKMQSQQTPPTYEENIVFIDEEDQTLRTLNLETRLENANCDELAQRVVYRYHLLNASSERGWCKELIKLGITLRWIAQRRIWLEQKSKAPQTHQRQYMSH